MKQSSRNSSPFRPLNKPIRQHMGWGMRQLESQSRQSDGQATVYSTPRWRKLAAEVKKERGYRCEVCGRNDTMLSVDHIIEIKDGGEPFNKANLRVVCGQHHHQKTWAEKKRRTWAAISNRLLAKVDAPPTDDHEQHTECRGDG